MPKAITNPSCNTNFLVKVSALIILFSCLFLSTIGQAADSVGILKFTHGVVNIESSSGAKRKAVKGDSLMRNEAVVTGFASIAVIQLNDDSRMTLRPNSAFRVSQLNMDDDSNDSSSQQSAVLNLLRGGLRLITGLIGKAIQPDIGSVHRSLPSVFVALNLARDCVIPIVRLKRKSSPVMTPLQK